MTIEVVIRADAKGVLSACVRQGQQYGRNVLLGRAIRDVGLAQSVAKQKLIHEFLRFGDVEIVWTLKV